MENKKKRKNAREPKNPRPEKKQALTPVKSEVQEDEEWSKYVKFQKVPNGRKKKEEMTTTEKKQQQQQAKKKKKKSDPLSKYREPCDMMRNQQRAQDIQEQVKNTQTVDETSYEQKALAVHVMPARHHQTAQTLALREDLVSSNSSNSTNDVDFCMQMKRLNYERSGENTRALEELMTDGFLSINNEHIDQMLICLSKDLSNDIQYAKKEQQESRAKRLAKSSSSSSNALLPGALNNKHDLSTKKLNLIFGNTIYHAFGYNRRTPQFQHTKIKSQDTVDRVMRLNEAYRLDALESETNFGEIASNFNMLAELKAQHLDKFKRRNEILCDSATMTSKVNLDPVNKEYIEKFRKRPVQGEELCANGEQCVFNKYIADKNACYIGKVFFTEQEAVRLEKSKYQKKSSPFKFASPQKEEEEEEEQEGPGYNEHRLCYDCLICQWTITHDHNVSKEVVPERPINYFTVQCKPGQYSEHCMLKTFENDRFTGIMGFVPRYSRNNRRIIYESHGIPQGDKFHTISTGFLGEVEMDF